MNSNFNINNIRAVIGLGNPEKKYLNTYHNVGYMLVDYLYKKNLNNPSLFTTDCNMNISGQFVQKILSYYKLKPEEIILIHDDSDLKTGQYKLSFDRGSAGHKGIESVINHLKTKKIWRLRIGIRPDKVTAKAEKFVLKKINEKEREVLEKTFSQIYKDIFSPKNS
jgi:peptidyl-tRNA hydrolase, PTH1 family